MNYLLAEHITKIYGDKVLFQDLQISINRGQKVALIARNGTGKSSLLRILSNQDSSDQMGSVRIRKDIRTGFLDQEPDFPPHLTVMEAIFHTDNPVLTLIQEYETALREHELQGRPETEQRLSQKMEQMTLKNAWDYEAKIKQILGKFKIHRLDQSVGVLSGGEKKRVAMAAILVQEPQLLILDEPTNHLDMEMVEWLEDYFAGQPNLSLLLVTHDRYFLDRVTDEIIELENGGLQRFKGNYSYYLEKKAELTANLGVEVEKARKLMKKELVWIRASPKARTTKSKSRIDAFDKIEEKARIKLNEDTLGFEGIKMERIGNKTIEIYHIGKKYGEQVILHDFSYIFKRRDRVGIVGKNGAGKTTLLKMLVGQERPDEGKIIIGKTLKFGYYTQTGLNFVPGKTVIEMVREIAEVLPMEKGKYLSAGQLLNLFQFPYSSHQNQVQTLSGGEKRRLHLLTILMQNPNFLILDEPTNDLDLLTLNLLEEYLLQYKGCLIIVSHDRYFMDKLVDHVFVFEGDGKVRDFPGNYTQYRIKRNKEIKEEREQRKIENQQQKKEQPAVAKQQKEKRKLSYNEKREFEQLEVDIEKLEEEKGELETLLNNGGSHEELMKWSQRMGEIVEAIDTKSDRWLELSEYDL